MQSSISAASCTACSSGCTLFGPGPCKPCLQLMAWLTKDHSDSAHDINFVGPIMLGCLVTFWCSISWVRCPVRVHSYRLLLCIVLLVCTHPCGVHVILCCTRGVTCFSVAHQHCHVQGHARPAAATLGEQQRGNSGMAVLSDHRCSR